MSVETTKKGTPLPPNKPRTAADNYEQRLNRLKANAEKDEAAREILLMAERLGEPNVLALERLAEIFGLDFVVGQSQEAIRLRREAEERGPAALADTNSAIATKKGQLRSRGGVFFFLMAQHSRELGLNWEGLRLPQLPGANFYNKPRPQKAPPRPAEAHKEVPPAPAIVPSSLPEPVTLPITGPKPARAKVNLSGNIVGSPRLNPQGLEGLVELTFMSEMMPTLPKGLPNLGSTKIVVWCTQKQFSKIKDTLKPDSRLIVEGELSVGVAKDLSPFARVICTKLSTVELEQAQRVEG